MSKQKTEELKIVYAKVGDLQLAEYNPKKFNSSKFKQLGTSVDNFGFVSPLVVNKRTMNVIDGNQRLKNEIKKGNTEGLLPVIFLDVDDEMERKLNVALGQTSTPVDPELALKELLSIKDQDEFIKLVMSDYEQRIKDSQVEKYEPEMNVVLEADESYDYLIFMADKGIDFLTVCNFFQVENVYDMNRQKMLGLGRALKTEALIKLIDFARKHDILNVNDIK